MEGRKKRLVALICGVLVLGGIGVGGVFGWQKYQEWHALRFARSVDAWLDRNLKHPEYKQPNLESFLYPETFAENCENFRPDKHPLLNIPTKMCLTLVHYHIRIPEQQKRKHGMTIFAFDPDSGKILGWFRHGDCDLIKTCPPAEEFQLYFQ